MTREEAIFTIEHRDGIMDYGETEQLAEALDLAIAALKAEQAIDEEMSDRFSMTKLEAYKRLTGVIDSSFYQMKKARMIGAMALKAEPCEDAVSLGSVIDTIEWYRTNPQHFTEDNLIEDIKGLPPVTPKQRTGKWIKVEDRTDWYDAVYKCSCCGREITTPYGLRNNLYSDYPYCHCGAKMEGESEEV